MKKAKVLVATAVVAAMTASTLAGCGNSSDKGTADQGGNAAADAAKDTQAADAGDESAGGGSVYMLNFKPEVDQQMKDLAAREGLEAVAALLRQEDPVAAVYVDLKNPRRVIRALEVAHFGETISRAKTFDETAEDMQARLYYDAFVIGLRWAREALYARINERVDLMMAAGLEQEVRGLLASGVTREMPAMKGIGYKEMAAYLAGEITREEAVEAIKVGTRHFAKRQLTWYRKMPYIHWYEPENQTQSELLRMILTDMAGFLQE